MYHYQINNPMYTDSSQEPQYNDVLEELEIARDTGQIQNYDENFDPEFDNGQNLNFQQELIGNGQLSTGSFGV